MRLYSSTFLIATVCLPVQATIASVSEKTAVLPDVTVQGRLADTVSPEDLPGHHDSLIPGEAVYSLTTTDQILEQASGIQIRQLGGIGQFSYPSLRGATGQQIQVVWDGIPVSSLNTGIGELPAAGLSTLGSIDIYRGTSPIELSPAASGGVIHLRSKNEESDNGGLSLGTGSFSSHIAGIWNQSRIGDTELFGSADWLTSENDFRYVQERNSVSDPDNPVTENRNNNAATHGTWLLRANHNISRKLQSSLLYQGNNHRREIPSFNNSAANRADYSGEAHRISSLTRYEGKITSLHFLVSGYRNQELYNDSNDQIGLGSQRDRYSTEGTLIQTNLQAGYQTISGLINLRYQLEDTEQKNTLLSKEDLINLCNQIGNCPSGFTREQLSAGLRLHWYPLSGLSFFSQVNALTLTDKESDTFIDDPIDNTQKYTTSDLGAEYAFSPEYSVSVLHSRQLRPATTSELFGDRGLTLGNPELKAETSSGFDVSFNASFPDSELTVSFYQRMRHDAITGLSDSRGVIRYENTGQTKHEGIELISLWNILPDLTLSGNSGLHRQTVTEHRFPAFRNNLLANQRRWDHNYSLQYQPSDWYVTAGYLRQEGGFYDQSNLLPIPAREILRLSAGYHWHNATVSVEADNLTDNRTTDFSNFPAPGRRYSIKLQYTW